MIAVVCFGAIVVMFWLLVIVAIVRSAKPQISFPSVVVVKQKSPGDMSDAELEDAANDRNPIK